MTETVLLFPTSFAQQRLWFLDQLAPGSPLYNMPAAFRLPPAVDVQALRRALAEILRRHESLRTTFVAIDGEPLQVVALSLNVPLPEFDLHDRAPGDREQEARRIVAEETARSFDLARGPLVRAAVLHLAADDHVLLLTIHHIVSDGWSMEVLFRELTELYEAEVGDRPSELPELAVQYTDYAVWQRRWLRGEALEEQMAYWRRRLEGAPPLVELPTDHPRPARQAFRGASLPVNIGPDLTASLRALADRDGATLFTVLVAAFGVLLHRHSGQENFVIGTPVANRVATETEPLIGFFVNTLALRLDLTGDPTFGELMRRVRETTTGALAHADVPFERLVAELVHDRDLSHAPLVQVMFALQTEVGAEAEADAAAPPGPQRTSLDHDAGTSKFDLTMSLVNVRGRLTGRLEYDTDLFRPATAQCLADRYIRVLEALAAGTEACISAIPLLSPAEREEEIVTWNRTRTPFPRDESVISLFEAQVARAPSAVAAEYGQERITYAALDASASRLARHLRGLGLARDVVVGVLAKPSIGMLVALVAVLKAGGAYLPLDPGDPLERLRFVIDDARALAVVAVGATGPHVGVPVVEVTREGAVQEDANADAFETRPAPGDLAYIIYTSGSTGVPKGVAVEHRAIVRLVTETDYLAFEPGLRIAQLAHPSFDAITFEIWGPLLSGGTLVGLPRSTVLEPAHLIAAIRDGGITSVFLTTALFNQVAWTIPDGFAGVRDVLTGGEACDPHAFRRVLAAEAPPERLVHVYGPTECTTFATWQLVSDVENYGSTIPIGRPIANTTAFVLDAARNPVPAGAIGELYLGGDGVARGYWRRPELTRERFVPDPFDGTDGARLYRTGDVVRRRPDGAIEFLGRRDEQVKIRGFRVEPGEVEAALRTHPEVSDVAVTVEGGPGGGKRLIAYVVGPDLEVAGLRRFLADRLPAWMLPAAFVSVATIPLMPSGKVDRRALAAAAPLTQTLAASVREPRTEIEQVAAGIWQEVLGGERVGLDDNFFEIGGHSLLVAQVVARIRERVGAEMSVGDLFASPRLDDFATILEERRRGAAAASQPIPVRADRSPAAPSFAQQRLWFLAQLAPASPFYNVPTAISWPADVDRARLAASLTALVGRHETLRTTFPTVGGAPLAVVGPPVEIDLPVDDLCSLPPGSRGEERRRLLQDELDEPFDLARGPLLRARLLLDEDEAVLALTLHHIVVDGWSLDIIRRELRALYAAPDAQAAMPPLKLQYADFAAWQRAWVESPESQESLDYWREQLVGAPTVLELPADLPRPVVQTFRGATLTAAIPPVVARPALALGAERGATPFMTLLAAFAVLLSRYTDRTDLVVGTPVAGRTRTELEPLVGLFVNTLPLRIDLTDEPNFHDVLDRIVQTTTGALTHAELPFDRIVSELAPERDATYSPLVQVLFDYERTSEARPVPNGSGSRPVAVEASDDLVVHRERLRVAKFDLTLVITDAGDGLQASCEFATDLFDPQRVERLLGHLVSLLAAVVADPEMPISRLPLVRPGERRLLLERATGPALAEDASATVLALFERRCREQPDAIAVAAPGADVRYGELDERANRLAAVLCRHGVGEEDRVAVCLDRSADFVVAVLGVLKAGGAYVPLDPAQPSARLAAMLHDSGAVVIITRSDVPVARALGSDRVSVLLDGEQVAEEALGAVAPTPLPSRLAYVVYTSGSTGRPKGVAVEHGSLTNHARAIATAYGLRADDRVLHMSAIGFDVAAEEILPTLAVGAAIVPWTERAAPSVAELLELVERKGITVVNLSSAYWHALVTELERAPRPLPASLRLLIAGSDRTSAARLAAWRRIAGDRVAFRNAYGPTEATITATLHDPDGGAASTSTAGWVPIGRPIAGVRAHVLDPSLEPVPVGVPGELYLGGRGVARGYANLPRSTAERFVPDPFDGGGARLYRTGDRARVAADGTIEFLGRVDEQVKIRGFRIEPGEVTAALLAHPGVVDAHVRAIEDDVAGLRLAGYVVLPPGSGVGVSDLRRDLRDRLPEAMVPTTITPLPVIQRRPSGKVDSQALPTPDPPVAANRAAVPPRSPVERKLAAIWAQVLRRPRVGVTDNFFELGGDSILAIQVLARAAAAGLRYTPRQMFQHQTIAALAAVTGTASPVIAEQGDVSGTVPLTPVQHWLLGQQLVDVHHYNQAVLVRLPAATDPELLRRAWAEVQRHHDALRLRLSPVGDEVELVHYAPDGGAFAVVDLTELERAEQVVALECAAAEAQAGLNPADGPIARAVFFPHGGSSRLLLVVHHLAVDGVSWRVLLEDVHRAYAQLAAGEEPALPPKTTSFQHWARRLRHEYAKTPALRDELTHWLAPARRQPAPLPFDRGGTAAANTEATARTVTVSLDRNETDALLHELPRAYRTQINDVLLCALAEAFERWTGERALLVDLEGHGREPLFDDVDLSRTVGWFTSIYPVLLELDDSPDPGARLKSVKEQLRSIPNHGIGYGVLRYLCADGEVRRRLAELPQAEVSFNYLGQFGAESHDDEAPADAREWSGPARGPRNLRRYLVDVTGGVFDGRLSMSFMYSNRVHGRATMDALASSFAAAVRALIARTADADGRDCTPSDFPLVDIDQRTLDELVAAHGDIEDLYPLSPLQEGLLFHTVLAPEAGHYVEQLTLDFGEGLDVVALERAWNEVVRRHPVLRTGFVWEGVAEPLQVVHRQVQLAWEHLDWRALSPELQRGRLEDWLGADRRSGYPLDRPPLMRMALARTSAGTHRLIWSCHHLLLDGWSVPLVLNEVNRFYAAFRDGTEIALAHPRPYRDYIGWLRRQDLDAAETFWRQRLSGVTAPTPLTIDRPQADVPSHEHDEVRLVLAPETTAALQALGRTHQVTLNTVAQAAWALVLGRYAGIDDVVFGATVAGRPPELAGVETMIGLFINTLPVRVHIPRRQSVLGWLRALQEQQSEARQYEHTPLADLQAWTDLPPGEALFESVLVFDNYPRAVRTGAAPPTNEAPRPPALERTSYPLTIVVAPGSRLTFKLTFACDRFDRSAIVRLGGHLRVVLEAMAARPGDPVGALPLLTDAENRRAVHDWNTVSHVAGRRHRVVQELFEEQAARSPDAAAVIAFGTTLSYAELNGRANRLAHELRRRGVGPDVPVGLLVERSADLPVGILGILKAGGPYVPLDPTYPAERIAFMLADSGARTVVTQRGPRRMLGEEWMGDVVLLDDHTAPADPSDSANPHPDVSPDHIAYVIYTSGSTGVPKGVALPHRALVNLIEWQVTADTPRREPRVLQFAPLSFDVSFQECLSTWHAGGTLVLVGDEERRDPTMLAQVIAECRVDRVFMPFVALQQLAEVAADRAFDLDLLEVVTAGEQLRITPQLRRFFAGRPGCVLHNQYGPSETHVVTSWPLTGAPERWPDLPPIGRPVAGTDVYVLDKDRRVAPVGVPGELYIGGQCLARGYWGRPALTADRFVPHPLRPGGRLYRTGDLARYGEDGAVEFLGRRDDQVKIRGFRIELGEVEAVLSRHTRVAQAAVVVVESSPGDKRLVAYVVMHVDDHDGGSADVSGASDHLSAALRGFLQERLPAWMVPSTFVRVGALPVTPSGKVDRRALTALAESPPSQRPAPRAAFGTPVEEALAAIWLDVLRIPSVGPGDNFFELGGHSLLATRLVSRIRRDLNAELALRTVFEAPVLEDLARVVAPAVRPTEVDPIPRRKNQGPTPASFSQRRLWLLEQANATTVFHISTAIPFRGIVDVEHVRHSLNEVIRRHDALRTTFTARDGVPMQAVSPTLEVDVPVDDLRTFPADERSVIHRHIARRHAEESFDLVRGPLVRARLVLDDGRGWLHVTLHHIVADGWSLDIVKREVTALYLAARDGALSPLPPLPISYPDFAAWQHGRQQGETLSPDLDYWRRHLEGAPALLRLPTDRPHPPVQDYRGMSLTRTLSPEVSEALQSLAQREDATLFMVLLAAYAVVLSRQSGQTDLVIGAPVAGRTRAEVEPLIGFFLNHLPLRLDLSGNPSLAELVAQVRDVALGAYAHQDAPFELLLEHLRPERHVGRTPVFQVFFNLLNYASRDPSAAAGRVVTTTLAKDSEADPVPTWSPFDFTLYAEPLVGGIRLQVVYRTALFDADRMRDLLDQVAGVAAQAVDDPRQRIGDLTLLTRRARTRLPDPRTPLRDNWRGAVHTLFAAHAQAHPDRVAVADPDAVWSYGRLDERSTAIAAQLRACGIGREDVVAIHAHRDGSLVWAILGVLKAGAAYTILDPSYPVARLLDYVSVARPAGLLALRSAGPVPVALQAGLDGAGCRCRLEIPRLADDDLLELPPAPFDPLTVDPVDADSLACLAFTSGSTGRPKAVEQRHGPLTHFLPWTAETFRLTHADRFSMLSGLSHDPLQRDIFTPLCLGASVHVPPVDAIGTPGRLASWLRAEQVTIAHLTPALAQVLTSHLDGRPDQPLPDLRHVFFVGDKVTRADVGRIRALAPQVTCISLYGATETQRAAGFHVDSPEIDRSETVTGPIVPELLPVGRGLPDVQLFVLTAGGQLAGVGELGEIHVRTPHLARGYRDDDALTRERFLRSPFTGAVGDVVYRSGDLGRYRADGLVMFAGRADLQVKVRGFRVEPAEVEAALAMDPRVREAAVVLRMAPAGDERLVAYVTWRPGNVPEARQVRALVAERVPDYMVPSAFVFLDALPVTPNGKLDAAALPDPFQSGEEEESRAAPRDEVESTIADVWSRLLGGGSVGIDDNFFELGGHSLLATQALSRIRDAFGVEVGLGRFFERPTVAGLADAVAEARVLGVGRRTPLRPEGRERHLAQRSSSGELTIPSALRVLLRELMDSPVLTAGRKS
jgi:amino acid adenylation domain-containing protein/non-ribosomal peptide synthase protein (TIGR01720 family)